MKLSRSIKVAVVALAAAAVATQTAFAAVSIQAGGSSFDANLLNACKVAWQNTTGNTFTYNSSDSGTGQKNQDAGIFEANFSDSGYAPAKASVLNIPLVMAPIAVIYNLPGNKDLYLSESTLSDIFAGKITKWNDPAIVADNNRSTTKIVYMKNSDGSLKKDAKGDPIVLRTQNVKSTFILPDKKIQVIYRSDSSGTTENFTNYLNKSAPSVWTKAKNKVFSAGFPGNINDVANLGRIVGAASSTGVSQLAGKTPYSITYAEVNYAKANKLKIANLINPAGSSVAPDSSGVGAFLSSASQDANGWLTYDYATKEKGAYPLGIVSYLLADTKSGDKTTAAAVADFAKFILSPACSKTVGEPLGFSVIDGDLLKKSLAQVAKIG